MGIESLKKVVDLGVEMHKFGAALIANGKNWPADVSLAFVEVPVLVSDVQSFLAVDGNIIPEFKDLTVEEAAELSSYVMTKFVVGSAKAEAIIGASLKLVLDVFVDGKALSAAIKA